MGQPRFLVRNLFSRRIYPLHVLTASAASGAGEIAGNEFGRIGNGNRDPLDFWTNETANTEVRGLVTCNVLRSADMCVIDRGHNLAGKQVILECSDDNFASPAQTVFDIVLPTGTATGSPTDALGVYTPEGAWLKGFLPRSAKYWRLRIPALGAGLKPQIVNVWLDLSWSPLYLDLPTAPHAHHLGGQASQTDLGWEIRSHVWVRRQGRIAMRLNSPFDYDLALDHIQNQFGLNRPMWIMHDDAQANRAVLALPVLGTIEILERSSTNFYPTVAFDWIEHEAKEGL